jgi:hypothetical protein
MNKSDLESYESIFVCTVCGSGRGHLLKISVET